MKKSLSRVFKVNNILKKKNKVGTNTNLVLINIPLTLITSATKCEVETSERSVH
jgi:hypothetical protein